MRTTSSHPSHDSVADVARRQLGLISRHQAATLGHRPATIRRRVQSGRWQLIAPGVYLINGAPISWRTTVLTACLSAGGVVSHRTAAALLDIEGFRSRRIEISVPRGAGRSRTEVPGVTTHLSTDLHLAAIVTIDALPVTDPARLAVDLGGVVPFDRYQVAVEDLVGRKLLDWEKALDTLVVHARRGRNGVGSLRSLLEERYGADIPQSALERVFVRLASARGLPQPELQYVISDADGFVARVDAAYPEQRLAIELDSLRWHGPARVFELDHRKRARLVAAGWHVLAFTWHMMLNDPDAVVRSVRALLRPARSA